MDAEIRDVLDGKRQWAVVCGDCRDVLPSLPPACVDLVFTSPPYNLGGEPWRHLGHWKPGDGGAGSKSKWRNGSDACGGVAYAGGRDDMPWPEYVAQQHAALAQCWRVLDDVGEVYYNHKPRVIGGKLWTPLELNPGLPLRQIVIWARAGGLNFNPTAYVPTHEWILILAKERFRLRDKGASGVGDVWRVPQEDNPLHPAPFPLGLPLRALETTKAELVLDPFCGSGTTGVACLQTGRRFIGVELSLEYAELARKRLEKCEIGGPLFKAEQPALFADPKEQP